MKIFAALVVSLFVIPSVGTAQPKTQPTQKPTQPAAAVKPSAEDLERWRQAVLHTPRPDTGCFTSEYPATTWTPITCGKASKTKLIPARGPGSIKIVGNTNDNTAQAASGNISWAEGSFDAVLNVKSACSAACPNFVCPINYKCSSGNLKNNYSIQLNTNYFATELCDGHPKCMGWQQFAFSNRACAGYDWIADILVTHTPACAFVEYWLLNYGSEHCPKHFSSFKNGDEDDCYATSGNAVLFKPFLIDDLGFMKLTGAVAGVHGRNDVVTFTYATRAYSVAGDNLFPDLGKGWNAAEFNVFGINNGAQVIFNTGSTLVVRIVVDSGTTSAPLCNSGSTTGETNNLWLTSIKGPATGPGPALIFTESNAVGTLPLLPCTDTLRIAGTN